MFNDLSDKREDKKNNLPSDHNQSGSNETSRGSTREEGKEIAKNSANKPKSIAPPPPVVTEFDHRIKKLRDIGKKRGKRYSIIGIIASFIIGMGVMGAGYYLFTEIINISGEVPEGKVNLVGDITRGQNEKLTLPEGWRECNFDLECREAQSDCCNCNNGGTQAGINEQYLSKWQNILNDRCRDIDCPAVATCEQGKVVCENRKCEFKEGIEEELSSEITEGGGRWRASVLLPGRRIGI